MGVEGLLAADGVGTPLRPELKAGALNAIVHLYRAEVGRMTAYRQRLDTTTNWAITSSALVTTFSLGNPTIPHAAFLFLMFVNGFFLIVEARRFRVYEAGRWSPEATWRLSRSPCWRSGGTQWAARRRRRCSDKSLTEDGLVGLPVTHDERKPILVLKESNVCERVAVDGQDVGTFANFER